MLRLKALQLIIFLSLLIAGQAWGACVGPDLTSVQSAVNAAARNGTVEVCAGTITWNGTLTFTKGLKLIGAGIDTTVITASASQAINWIADATASVNNEMLEISGFTFDGNEGTHSSGMIYIANNDVGHPMTNIKIHDNKFKNEWGRTLYFIGPAWGVAYLNRYDRCQAVIDLFGTGQEGSIEWKQLTQEYGTVNNFYYEDNHIYWSSAQAGVGGGDEVGQGSRLVRRYNTWDETNAGGDELWDVHGLQTSVAPGTGQTCESMSSMVSEIYGNRVINYPSARRWLYLRGGWNLTFDNTYEASSGSAFFNYGHYGCDSCVYAGNMGGLSSPWPQQGLQNTYLWSNFTNGSLLTSITSAQENCTGAPLVENTNWHISKGGVFDGTTGVGCGTLAQMNAITTCTQGVGFWVTDQSCSDVSPYVGSSITNPSRTNISGSLHKCGASNNWVLAYTPFQYPHPLRNAPGGDTTPPTITLTTPTANPTYWTNANSFTFGGTASDNVAVDHVTCTNSQGGGCSCTGTTAWTCGPVTLSAGAATLTAKAYDAAGNNSQDAIVVTYGASVIEGESGYLVSPMQTGADAGASGGQYISSTVDASGTATFVFNVPTAGNYKFRIQARAADTGTNSFFFDIDASGQKNYEINHTADPAKYNLWFEEDLVFWTGSAWQVFTADLSAGDHTMVFSGRESGSWMDYFKPVSTAAPPGGSGISSLSGGLIAGGSMQ